MAEYKTPETPDCRAVHPMLGPYMDGELETGKHVQVADHLKSCAACTQDLAVLRNLDAAAARLAAAMPSEETWRQRWQVIHATLAAQTVRPHEEVRKKFSAQWLFPALAAAALILMALLSNFHAVTPTPDITQAQPQNHLTSNDNRQEMQDEAPPGFEIMEMDMNVEGYFTVVYTSEDDDVTVIYLHPDQEEENA